MWKKEKTKRLIKEVVKKYGKEIAIEGSNAVLGLEEYLDKIVAELMGIELEIIKIARQWRAVIERAAITDGFDGVRALIESEEEKRRSHTEEEEIKTEEIEMKLEEREQATLNITASPPNQLASNRLNSEPALANKVNSNLSEDMEDIKTNKDSSSTKSGQGNFEAEKQTVNEVDLEVHKEVFLDQSIWAPKKESCMNKRDIETKVAAINVLGENMQQREKSLRWSLRENIHIKKISEKFEKGNLWCKITFDCERGYEEAKVKLENSKEDFEKLRLIREEIKETPINRKVQGKSPNSTKKEESKAERESRAKRELEEIYEQRKERTLQYITPQHAAATKNKLAPKQQNQSPELELSKDHITIWDLPTWARRSQVFESIRYLGRVAHIEMIREPHGKTRAEVNFLSNTVNSKDLAEIWCLP